MALSKKELKRVKEAFATIVELNKTDQCDIVDFVLDGDWQLFYRGFAEVFGKELYGQKPDKNGQYHLYDEVEDKDE